MRKRSVEDRFHEKYEAHGNGCWIWTANQSKGYGLFWYKGTNAAAHRVAYELLVGPIPDGLVIDHLCRTPLCVNPEHMEPVTGRENVLRGVGFPAVNAAKTHCPKGHEYDAVNTYINRHGARICKACRKATMHAYWLARKAA